MHLDITFIWIAGSWKLHPLFLYFLEKRLAIRHLLFTFTSKMVFVLLVSVLFFGDPLPSPYIGWQYRWGGGEELKWHQLAHHQLMRQQGPHFSSHSKLKSMIKAHSSGRLVSSGISDVVIASVYYEKTCLKKLMMKLLLLLLWINRKKRWFLAVPKTDFRYETKARKVMVDFKFDALYR